MACSYCYEIDHNIKKCSRRKEHTVRYENDQIKLNKEINIMFEELGIGPGAILSVEENYPPYFKRNVMCISLKNPNHLQLHNIRYDCDEAIQTKNLKNFRSSRADLSSLFLNLKTIKELKEIQDTQKQYIKNACGGLFNIFTEAQAKIEVIQKSANPFKISETYVLMPDRFK